MKRVSKATAAMSPIIIANVLLTSFSLSFESSANI